MSNRLTTIKSVTRMMIATIMAISFLCPLQRQALADLPPVEDLAPRTTPGSQVHDLANMLDGYNGSNADLLAIIALLRDIDDDGELEEALKALLSLPNAAMVLVNQQVMSMFLSTLQARMTAARQGPANMLALGNGDDPSQAIAALTGSGVVTGDVSGFVSGLAMLAGIADPGLVMAMDETNALPPVRSVSGELVPAFMSPFTLPGASFAGITINPDLRFGTHARYFCIIGNQDSDGDDLTGYYSITHGVAGGLDYLFTDNFLAGLSLGYAATDITFDDGHESSADAYSLNLGGYASYFGQDWHVDGTVTLGFNTYYASRRVVSGTVDRTANSDHSGLELVTSLGGGYDFSLLDDSVKIGPVGGLDYMHLSQSGYTESGAGALNLEVGEQSSDSFKTSLGAHVAWILPDVNEWLSLTFDGQALWVHEYVDQDVNVDASLQGNPSASFELESGSRPRDSVRLGAGVEAELYDVAAVYLQYMSELTTGFASHGITLGLRYEF